MTGLVILAAVAGTLWTALALVVGFIVGLAIGESAASDDDAPSHTLVRSGEQGRGGVQSHGSVNSHD